MKEICDAIIDGVDPKSINRLWLNLGLNQLQEEYEELLLYLNNDSNIQDQYKYLAAKKDGTIHIGSTPDAI